MGFGLWNRAYKNPPPQAQKMSLTQPKVIPPPKGMTMTDNTLLGDISKATLAMREDEKQQFSALVRILIRCYTEKDQKMAIFMSSDDLESATLASVNADEQELHELIHFVSALVGVQSPVQQQRAMRLN
jgi:hypothetical protein